MCRQATLLLYLMILFFCSTGVWESNMSVASLALWVRTFADGFQLEPTIFVALTRHISHSRRGEEMRLRSIDGHSSTLGCCTSLQAIWAQAIFCSSVRQDSKFLRHRLSWISIVPTFYIFVFVFPISSFWLVVACVMTRHTSLCPLWQIGRPFQQRSRWCLLTTCAAPGSNKLVVPNGFPHYRDQRFMW